ncbi:hypothetical protein [Chryseobacterium wanjuense]
MCKKLFFIFSLYSSLLFTPKKTDPSEAYFKMVSDKIAPKDPVRAIKIADSLIISAKTPEIKGRSYMLAANIFFFKINQNKLYNTQRKQKKFLIRLKIMNFKLEFVAF